ncbi:hypothetical protein HELRODRAFT_186752 [Helobdella robusta]|uniref:cyclin-dependent kinase n=1 Tax=Helobdella robusta TaxID=6412 RepID=T1FP29_HELRO|nr:hypothetical protein HELRODRAFT_186752 [Helobdella robusta]ESO09540.1 hypothetical protein HELRODRAFT_186752 [Helobdella robusta]
MASSDYPPVKHTIGRGAYATVYKGRDKNVKGRYVAMKEVILPTNNEDGLPPSSVREIGLLKHIEKTGHPNIVKLLDVFFGNRSLRHTKLVLVFEHCNQDLSQYISRSPESGIDCKTIKSLMHQILSGIDFLHSHRVFHRDLKPQNILVSDEGVVRIADFGLAKIYSCDMTLTSVVVTLYYRSPEVLLNLPYGSSVDLWSCGCILAELFTGRPLFPGTSEHDQISRIFQCLGVPSERDFPDVRVPLDTFTQVESQSLENLVPQATPPAFELIKRMLVYNGDERITAKQALDHAFIKDAVLPVPSKMTSSSSSSSSSPDCSSSPPLLISGGSSRLSSPPHKRSNLTCSNSSSNSSSDYINNDKQALTENSSLYNSSNASKNSSAAQTLHNSIHSDNTIVYTNNNSNDDSKPLAYECSPAKKTR